ncbi:NAD-dependent epimerase/dehydratase family protein [Altericista sp. CCNU0014]|uniref:NAD-dependent epimerase/dehydratase family protein n=1 Tax=Altericista sp. CCNU0014 TaxID=3082949 RepID=UPI00384B7E73
MAGRRILITGASGCIGHYLCETFIQHADDELFLVMRDPQKLRVPVDSRPGVHIVQADLRHLDPLRDLLSTIHCAVLVATGWGDPELDIDKTLELIEALDPQVCQQVIYFSTASILGRDERVLPEAKSLGTEYVKAKAICYEKLMAMELAFPVFTVFPTLVVGGDDRKPYSHFASGLPEALKQAGAIRFLRMEGSFHFIHAQDIATIALQIVQHPELAPSQTLVLGNEVVMANEAIAALCAFAQKRIYFQLDLNPWLVNVLIRLFNIRMGAWDYFCLSYRHFQYANPISPKTFNQPTYCSTFKDVLSQSLRS